MTKRREYNPDYKAKIVLEVISGEKTLSEIASNVGINVKQLGNWKKEFIDKAGRVFAQNRIEKEMEKRIKEFEEKEQQYQAKVGQLTLEVDFLKKKHEQMYGSGWEAKVGYKR